MCMEAKGKVVGFFCSIGRFTKHQALRFVDFLFDQQNFDVLLVVLACVSAFNYLLLCWTADIVHKNASVIIPTIVATITGTSTQTTTIGTAGSATSLPTITVTPWAVDTLVAALPYPIMRYPVNWDISMDGLKYVEFWEGFSATKYDDGGQPGVGNCTIGYGHLLHLGPCNGSEGVGTEGFASSISQYQAEQLLLQELRHCGTYVAKYVTVRVSQNQYNILSGLVCGVGYDRFKTYKFTALLNQGMYYEAAEQLRVTGTWGIGIGYCPGLVRRRKYEADRFTTNIPLWPIPPGY
jgi:lysozyme